MRPTSGIRHAGTEGAEEGFDEHVEGTRVVRLTVAARMLRVPPTFVRRYVRAGLVQPVRVEGRVAWFGDHELARLRLIRRLQRDLGLNLAGVEVVLRLLEEIHSLRTGAERPDR